jgi:Ser/Thr protein kinase RdoA (MazF antagonist)
MNSYVNRVFELETDSGLGLIAKFYRPLRWSPESLQEEHDFLLELQSMELPVVAPLQLSDGSTLASFEGRYFAVFPKMSGRGLDEPNEDDWGMLGRLLAQVHNAGAVRRSNHRMTLSPARSTRTHLDMLLKADVLQREVRGEYERVVNEIIQMGTPMFQEREFIRIHGDCHRGNIIRRAGERLWLIDFDDMMMGPPVQDLWMLLPDVAGRSGYEIELFLEGYTTFRQFNRQSIALIEMLRAMRYIHFAAWCAVQRDDASGLQRIVPGWGSVSYWRGEIHDLRRQLEAINQPGFSATRI